MLLEFCQKTEEILPTFLLIDVVLVEDGGLKVGDGSGFAQLLPDERSDGIESIVDSIRKTENGNLTAKFC